jgi:hypothetical protein
MEPTSNNTTATSLVAGSASGRTPPATEVPDINGLIPKHTHLRLEESRWGVRESLLTVVGARLRKVWKELLNNLRNSCLETENDGSRK